MLVQIIDLLRMLFRADVDTIDSYAPNSHTIQATRVSNDHGFGRTNLLTETKTKVIRRPSRTNLLTETKTKVIRRPSSFASLRQTRKVYLIMNTIILCGFVLIKLSV